jgi:hypothetical protein
MPSTNYSGACSADARASRTGRLAAPAEPVQDTAQQVTRRGRILFLLGEAGSGHAVEDLADQVHRGVGVQEREPGHGLTLPG